MLFHPALKAYLTCHSWIIAAYILLGDLSRQLCMFNHQKTLTHPLLPKLQGQLLALHFVFNALLDELSNIDSIYKSYKPAIRSVVQLLKTESEFENLSPHENQLSKRCILSFLGNALKWLTGTATMKNTQEIKQHVNHLMQEQTNNRTF